MSTLLDKIFVRLYVKRRTYQHEAEMILKHNFFIPSLEYNRYLQLRKKVKILTYWIDKLLKWRI